MASIRDFSRSCPIPLQDYPQILLAHGSGGRLMHQLIETMFRPTFGTHPDWQHDAARLSFPQGKLAFTTDSYVVSPLFFPGGNIGSLAVYGTVNDLAMTGARPLYLSVGFIFEEGLSMAVLWQVVQSMQRAAAATGVQIVTGDTKVVERGQGDDIYINTAGIGILDHPWIISPQAICPGDAVLLSGDIGRHAIAIMAERAGLDFETPFESDLAPLTATVQALLAAGIELHCLRDLTRGGLATALNEIAVASGCSIQLEAKIPVSDPVQGACEILGFDPLYLANEGRFIVILPAAASEAALHILQSCPSEQDANLSACRIGSVETSDQSGLTAHQGIVKQYTGVSSNRILDYRPGDQLPRIC